MHNFWIYQFLDELQITTDTVVAKKDKTTLLEMIHFNGDIFENCVPQLLLLFWHLAKFLIFPA